MSGPRSHLLMLLPALALLLPNPGPSADAVAMGERSKFVLARLRYRGGNWNPRPTAPRRVLWETVKRTSIDATLETVALAPDDPALFNYPFLYMAGDEAFEPFTAGEVEQLRRYLLFGGTLLIDDAVGRPGNTFEESVRREMARVFPDLPLQPLPAKHTIFQTFYLLDRSIAGPVVVGGRTLGSPNLEGVTKDDRTMVIYCGNDLGGAWAKDTIGNYEYDVVPGGEHQREMSFRLGINVIMYALTCNYKRDQVHTQYILERRRLR